MDQPLWQNWLNIALIGFVARRAAVAVAIQWESLSPLLRASYIAVLGACALAAIAVWMSVRWVIGSLCSVAALFAVASLLELAQVEPAQRVWVLTQLVIALAGTAALVQLARRNAAHRGT
jgi:hypothetical protein